MPSVLLREPPKLQTILSTCITETLKQHYIMSHNNSSNKGNNLKSLLVLAVALIGMSMASTTLSSCDFFKSSKGETTDSVAATTPDSLSADSADKGDSVKATDSAANTTAPQDKKEVK
jgi:hypothetical protein